MSLNQKRWIGIIFSTVLFVMTASLVQYIPNPMVPGAIIGLNMIIPFLAAYFFGPLSGLIVGSTSSFLSAVIYGDMFYLVGVFSMGLMSAVAGWAGTKDRSGLTSALIIIPTHLLNMLVIFRVGLMTFSPELMGGIWLGLATEAIIDVVAIFLFANLLKRWFYFRDRY